MAAAVVSLVFSVMALVSWAVVAVVMGTQRSEEEGTGVWDRIASVCVYLIPSFIVASGVASVVAIKQY